MMPRGPNRPPLYATTRSGVGKCNSCYTRSLGETVDATFESLTLLPISVLKPRSAVRAEPITLVLDFRAAVCAYQGLLARPFGEGLAAGTAESVVGSRRPPAGRTLPGHYPIRTQPSLVRA